MLNLNVLQHSFSKQIVASLVLSGDIEINPGCEGKKSNILTRSR